jgi:hypothetical protein
MIIDDDDDAGDDDYMFWLYIYVSQQPWFNVVLYVLIGKSIG